MRNAPIDVVASRRDISARPTSVTDTTCHEIHECRSLADFTRLRPAWNTFVATCPPCLDLTYCESAATRAFERGATVSVALVYEGATLVALWPVMIALRGACRVARALGCGSDQEYGGPLVADPANVRLYTAALEAVRHVAADVLEIWLVGRDDPLASALSHVPRSWMRRLVPARWRGVDSYSIARSGSATYDAFLATRPESLRSHLRRHARRLAERGAVEYGWCQSVADAREVLTWIFANKRRWALARGFDTPFLMDDQVRDFFIALAERANLVATPLVSFVKMNGAPVAASVNLVGTHSIEYFITTYDETYAAFSVGNLLVDSIARWAHTSGRDFDFRPFRSVYKERWSNCMSRHESHTVMLTLRGRLAEIPIAVALVRRVLHKARAVAFEHTRQS
ncbi:MAG TPA: GNAT family N-acetyltransferase [Paraburkholderia sp.]|jgi:CelD/BcsL family acetyltransferase involved in cellulose biosynthesis|uniref:GNAT family N-acetyltransferase n=1 Tax=Paraburkholderia sp. TaxID=1926495 RepID=UPI002B49713C|nr:GNAT family N-acetyltransferase [Paraburkholderia sp.]HKR41888.1 GNAT family N-acetyltransferase [Paraburkholderia sp.]